MQMCCSIFGIFSFLVVFTVAYLIYPLLRTPPVPVLQKDQYWGPGSNSVYSDSSIRPFRIKFHPDMIKDLHERLNRTRYTKPYEYVGFEYGFKHNVLEEVVHYWTHKYDFSKRERLLNKYPQFKTEIQGLDIHFIHVVPEKKDRVRILPLLMLHGWPGSVKEFYGIIPLLTTHRKDTDFVFELIIPSLPGFGFSDAPSKKGLSAMHVGVVMINLMERLGHKSFYIQGGDLGAMIASSMATLFPQHIIGHHTNMAVINSPCVHWRTLVGSLWPSMFVNAKFIRHVYPLWDRFMLILRETGHLHIQATKPDSVGAALGDSPAGLAAYILEKYTSALMLTWEKLVDGDEGRDFIYLDDLLDNVMFYWVGNAATTSARLYAESYSKEIMALKLDSIPTGVPTAVARFPLEIVYLTDAQLYCKYSNLVQATDMPLGGHFAAFEEPLMLSDDIISGVKKMTEYYRMQKEQRDHYETGHDILKNHL